MSRDSHESWDAPPRSRDADRTSRAGRRRASRRGKAEQVPAAGADDHYQYGSGGYGGQDDYGSRRYADSGQYGEPGGYGGYADDDVGGRADQYPGAGYGSDGDATDGYGGDGYAGQDYSGRGYNRGDYADDGYPGYADDGYGGRGYGDDGYGRGYPGEAQDPYASRDAYGPGDAYPEDAYASRDPYGRSDSRASGPHGGADPRDLTDPRSAADSYGGGADGYDTGARRGYARPDGDAAAYGGRDGYGEQEGYGGPRGYAGQDSFGGRDPYASPGGSGYEHGGGYDEQGERYGWQDAADAREAVDDPGLARRRRRTSDDSQFDADDSRHDGFFRGFGGGDEDGLADHRRRPAKKRRGHAGLIALGLVLVVFLGIAGVGYHYYSLYKSRHATYQGSGYGSVYILVKPGDTADSISEQLLSKHVIAAIDPWAAYVANKSGLQPGKYRLHLHMSPAAAWAMLANLKNRVNSTFTIPDGLRLADILPLMAKDSGLPLSDFQSAIKNTAALGLPSYAHGNPQGYLYPDTYDIAPGETALKMLQTAVHQFNVEAASLHLVAAAQADQFTPAQVIVGASLLEGEVGPKYYADVARVIDNRLNQGMALQLDSTIAFALNKHTDQLSQSDKNVNSPYNTFKNTGLPPGPIGSPDAAAIQAFLHPVPHTNTWLYFVTVDKKGTTLFTSDYNQFLSWSNQAKQNGV